MTSKNFFSLTRTKDAQEKGGLVTRNGGEHLTTLEEQMSSVSGGNEKRWLTRSRAGIAINHRKEIYKTLITLVFCNHKHFKSCFLLAALDETFKIHEIPVFHLMFYLIDVSKFNSYVADKRFLCKSVAHGIKVSFSFSAYEECR